MLEKKILCLLGLCCFFVLTAQAQIGRQLQSAASGGLSNNPFSQEKGKDSLNRPHKHVEEKITISYRYLDDVKDHSLDTSIDDYYRYLPLQATDVTLGNLGQAEHSLIFDPRMQPGWDPGFHALDAYRFQLDSTQFYTTTRPYTVLEYLIGGKQQQMIDAFHTQNPRENLNFGFHYRKINSPGFFQNQNTNDDSYNIFVHINSKNKRYNVYVSYMANKLNAGENGGLKNDDDLSNSIYSDRRTIPVYLGGNSPYSIGFFSAPIATKSSLKESGLLFRHQYDWGKGDTVQVNDTLRKYEFYPVFRVEHTLRLDQITTSFTDTIPDSAAMYYGAHYGIADIGTDNIYASHKWVNFSNDLSLEQFPVRTNPAQFIKAGVTFESIRGSFLYNSISFSNILGHFEYHNTTKNKKWDLDAAGQLYLAGNNFGDYKASASLSRYLNDKLGNIRIGFVNLNQTPSFIYRFFQSNRFVSNNPDLKNTNLTRLQFAADNPVLKYHLEANYYLITNYTYFKNYQESAQYSSAFNLLQVLFSKRFTAGHFNWYLDLAYQQTDGATPLHVPNFWTRDRFTFEGLFFKNLNWCSGLEFLYNTAYYADDYSPMMQQFVYQKDDKISNTYPSAAAFVHLRIKTFTAYVRAENLNAFIGDNIMQAPHYPYPDFMIQVGFKWGYIN